MFMNSEMHSFIFRFTLKFTVTSGGVIRYQNKVPEVLLYTPSLSRRFLNTKSDLRYIFIQVKRVIRAWSLISNTVCWFHIVKSKFHCAFCCFASVIPCVHYDTGVDFILVSYYSSWGDSEFKRKSKNKRVHFTIQYGTNTLYY
jgi:hypothetical protein